MILHAHLKKLEARDSIREERDSRGEDTCCGGTSYSPSMRLGTCIDDERGQRELNSDRLIGGGLGCTNAILSIVNSKSSTLLPNQNRDICVRGLE